MADLYNLADPTVEEELQEADEEPTHQEWDVAETVELPPALEDAAKHKALLGDDDEDVTNELTTSTTKVLDQHLSINQSYLKLQKMWTQEMCSQEILHFDEDVFAEIVRRINEAEEYIETTSSGNFQGNAIKNALFTSVISVDLERSKFLICSLLKHRLHKIEAFPYYMRDHSDRLRESEVRSKFCDCSFLCCGTLIDPYYAFISSCHLHLPCTLLYGIDCVS